MGAHIGAERDVACDLPRPRASAERRADSVEGQGGDRRKGARAYAAGTPRIKPPVEETLRLLEGILHREFTASFMRDSANEGQQHLAEIINRLESTQIEQVLASLAATSPKAAESLKRQLFTFDDLAKVSQRARAALFDKVPAEKAVLALRGASPELREMILSSLSSRVRKMIEQELNNGQAVPAREVAEARRTITDLALAMASRGEIEIRGESEDMVA
jgi:flagellar motor switch protein FliG